MRPSTQIGTPGGYPLNNASEMGTLAAKKWGLPSLGAVPRFPKTPGVSNGKVLGVGFRFVLSKQLADASYHGIFR